MKIEIKKPIVYEYLSLQLYLQNYYQYRKYENKRFSYETWLMEMGLSVNRSFIRLVVLGKKKAPASFVEAFCKQCFESKKEIEYFINDKNDSNIQIIKGTAANIDYVPSESVDYIYTDPP